MDLMAHEAVEGIRDPMVQMAGCEAVDPEAQKGGDMWIFKKIMGNAIRNFRCEFDLSLRSSIFCTNDDLQNFFQYP